jgi:thiamine-monophosphate kinase
LRGTASAVIDVSDGLVADLGHICTASGVAAELQAAAVPLSPAAREIVAAAPLRLVEMITGGDDYELCLTVPPAREAALRQAADAAEVPVCRVGRIKEGAGVAVLAPDGSTLRLQRTGYRHF